MTLNVGLLLWTLLQLIILQGVLGEPRLAKPGSTHPSFPLDAFARPAYKVVFQDNDPVDNQTALSILKASRSTSNALLAHGLEKFKHADEQIVDESRQAAGSGDFTRVGHDGNDVPFRAYLHRSSPDTLHVCTLAEVQTSSKGRLQLDEQGMREYRIGVLQRALALLSPLKGKCLYHTMDWFTYSMCYGDSVKQFHAIPSTLGMGKTPTMDPAQDSFVVGRWKRELERTSGTKDAQAGRTSTVGDGSDEGHVDEAKEAANAPRNAEIFDGEGTELMEMVHFSSIDEPRPRADETHVQIVESNGEVATSGAVEGKGRYVSQLWSDGTLCNINNEPRTAEVQFHCAKSVNFDRIALVREVTTCNYVVVIETPRLCNEPVLAQAEDEVNEIHCRPIWSEDALRSRLHRNIHETQASLLDEAKKHEDKMTSKQASSSDEETDPTLPFGDVKGEAEALDETKVRSSDSLQAQLSNLIEEALSKKTRKLEDGTIEDIEVVVGMDENGQIILEPRGGSLTDRVSDLADDVDDTFYGAPAVESTTNEGESQEGRKKNTNAESWADVLQQIRDLGLLNADGVLYQVVNDNERHGADQDASSKERTPKDNTQQSDSKGGKRSESHARHAKDGHRQGTSNGGQGEPRRGGMVRETETFAQRVDRIYKAQEQEERKKQRKDGAENEERKEKKNEPMFAGRGDEL